MNRIWLYETSCTSFKVKESTMSLVIHVPRTEYDYELIYIGKLYLHVPMPRRLV